MAGLVDSYLRGEARAFFPLTPTSAADRRSAVAAAVRPLDPAVADELERQNARHAPSPARAAHLAALRRGAAAVVTGQQVGLFLGPLYTVYKAAAAIRDARALAEESGAAVVPVFWLQTEDHDLPEIAGCCLPTASGDLAHLALPAAASDRISIAHRKIPAAIEGQLAQLREVLEDLPHGPAHLDRIGRHYRAGAGWGEAFAGLLAELFADEGLVLLDPRTPAFAAAAVPIHRRALEGAELIARGLRAGCERLEAAGFDVAVHVREEAPLSFFHPDGPTGPRYRLDAHFAEVGGSGRHTRQALLERLEAEPLAFSTSALLRPILQDTLLPTAAYVGGPGEIAYFAQLAPLYAAFDKRMPLVVPRARFRVIEPRAKRLLVRHDLAPQDAAQPEEALLARCSRAALPDSAAVLRSLLAPFEQTLDEAAAPLRGELEKALARTRTSVRVAAERFAARYERARLHRDEAVVADVRKLQRLLHPKGAPQERNHGLAWYGARYGDRAFLETILASVRPFDGSLLEIEP